MSTYAKSWSEPQYSRQRNGYDYLQVFDFNNYASKMLLFD